MNPLERMFQKIENWDTFIKLLERSSDLNMLETAFRKANGLAWELDMNKLNEGPLKHLKELLSKYDTNTLFEICRNSFLGNLFWIFRLLDDTEGIINSKNLACLEKIPKLKFIDEIMFIKPNFGKRFFVKIDEIDSCQGCQVETLNGLRFLFYADLVELEESFINSFSLLLRKSENPKDRAVLKIVEILKSKNEQLLLNEYQALFGEHPKSVEDLNLKELYEKLLELGCPVFFEDKKLRFNGVVYNGNFFPMKFTDKTGKIRILGPFEQIELGEVAKLQDPIKGDWFTPIGRLGKILIEEIYSFSKMKTVRRAEKEEISKIEELSENEIEEKLRCILGEPGITEHTPLEIADFISLKIKINNDEDLRNCAIIIKKLSGKKQITLKDVANQIIKAVNSHSEIIMLVHVAPLADDVTENFTDLCKKLNKMYCMVNKSDLARLFKAYNLI